MTCCPRPTARRLGLTSTCVIVLLLSGTTARADLDTDPYLFTDQPITASGRFEWDEFSAVTGFGGPHAPDVAGTGVGSAEMTVTGIPQPMDGPPFGLVASTQNLYTGGMIGHWDLGLTDLATDQPNTTLVLQIAALGPLNVDSFVLDGMPPASFVERGIAPAVAHDIDTAQAEFDTQYYWAEWQVDAAEDYLLEFSGVDTHLSFAAARVDYFNTATVFDAVEAVAVPEPPALALAGIALCGLIVARSHRRRIARLG